MSAKYRRLDPRLWRDEKVRAFDPLEKLIAIYTFTAQSNRIGCFVFSTALAAEELGIPSGTFRPRFRRVLETLGWRYHEPSRVLFIPTWWKYNRPEGPNQMIGVLTDLHDVPASPLVSAFGAEMRYLSETLRRTFTKTLRERYPKGLAIQEQEQEQEQDPPLPPEGGSGTVPLDSDRVSTLETFEPRAPSGNGGGSPRRRRRAPGELTAEQRSRFDRFWSAYPRHEAKLDAEKAWRQLDPDEALTSRILAAVVAQTARAEWTPDRKRFIPYPATWLNGRRWEDEIGPPSAVGDGNPYAGEPIYSDADMDENEEPRPEAVARETARIAALRARHPQAVVR